MNWKKVRMILYGISFISGLFFLKIEQERAFFEFNDDPVFEIVQIVLSILAIFFVYPALIIVVGVQAKNPLSDKIWYLPDHTKNPLILGQPLYFFHFAAYSGIFYSAGILISFLWNGWFGLLTGLFFCLAFGNVLGAVRLCIRVYKGKFQKSE